PGIIGVAAWQEYKVIPLPVVRFTGIGKAQELFCRIHWLGNRFSASGRTELKSKKRDLPDRVIIIGSLLWLENFLPPVKWRYAVAGIVYITVVPDALGFLTHIFVQNTFDGF